MMRIFEGTDGRFHASNGVGARARRACVNIHAREFSRDPLTCGDKSGRPFNVRECSHVADGCGYCAVGKRNIHMGLLAMWGFLLIVC